MQSRMFRENRRRRSRTFSAENKVKVFSILSIRYQLEEVHFLMSELDGRGNPAPVGIWKLMDKLDDMIDSWRRRQRWMDLYNGLRDVYNMASAHDDQWSELADDYVREIVNSVGKLMDAATNPV